MLQGRDIYVLLFEEEDKLETIFTRMHFRRLYVMALLAMTIITNLHSARELIIIFMSRLIEMT